MDVRGLDEPRFGAVDARALSPRLSPGRRLAYIDLMTRASTFTVYAVAIPLAGAALAASLWLWARYGMGVYFDTIMGAIASCF